MKKLKALIKKVPDSGFVTATTLSTKIGQVDKKYLSLLV